MKSCLLYLICNEEKVYSPAFIWLYGIDMATIGEEAYYAETMDANTKYWIFFYMSVNMFKGNETGPRTNNEVIWFSVILLLDLIVSGNIFGNVASLVQMSNRKAV